MWPWEWDASEWLAAAITVGLLVFFASDGGQGTEDGGAGSQRER